MPADTPGNVGSGDDTIHIEGLDVWARIGVPDEERQRPQRLTVSLTMWPDRGGLSGLNDDLSRTIDYSAVAECVRRLINARADKLLETLADAVASLVLAEFPVRRVRVELRKFVLPETRYVAVALVRERSA